jgi:uracil-DNA glycosylase family 4
VGLAPGAQGANRTGVPFFGDSSGDTLRTALCAVGLRERDVRITNALKCLPPENRPAGGELANCRSWFTREISDLKRAGGVIFALGRVAHIAIVKEFGARQADFRFGHANVHMLPGNTTLVDSYHCSQYNTATRRLTPAMLERALRRAAHLTRQP